MRGSMLLALLALAACDKPAPRAPTAGQVERGRIDAAMTAYAQCVYGAAKRDATAAATPGDIVDAAVAGCSAQRADLVTKVGVFQKIGAPTSTPAYTRAVAEQSVAAMEEDLRSEATTIAIDRQNLLGKK